MEEHLTPVATVSKSGLFPVLEREYAVEERRKYVVLLVQTNFFILLLLNYGGFMY
jgi:hypothetical protein